jgi:hypothetical protein
VTRLGLLAPVLLLVALAMGASADETEGLAARRAPERAAPTPSDALAQTPCVVQPTTIWTLALASLLRSSHPSP